MQSSGFSFLELLVAVSLVAIILTGTLTLTSSTTRAHRTQQDSEASSAGVRFAFSTLSEHISQAGFSPVPWQTTQDPDMFFGSLDSVSQSSDRLTLSRWSNRNCMGNANPQKDSNGLAQYFLLRVSFWQNSDRRMVVRCEYGPDDQSLVRQINNNAIVDRVLGFQMQFAESPDQRTPPVRWVNANNWEKESNIKAIKVALAVATESGQLHASGQREVDLLGTRIRVPNPELHVRTYTAVFAIQGRL